MVLIGEGGGGFDCRQPICLGYGRPVECLMWVVDDFSVLCRDVDSIV